MLCGGFLRGKKEITRGKRFPHGNGNSWQKAFVPSGTFAHNDVMEFKTVIRGANAVKAGIRALKWEKTRKTSRN